MTGTYKVIASRLAKTKKEEAARNADLGDVMASRDAQIERLKADLMLQDKMTKKVMDELRLRQEMLMGRRRAWEERRLDLLDIVEARVRSRFPFVARLFVHSAPRWNRGGFFYKNAEVHLRVVCTNRRLCWILVQMRGLKQRDQESRRSS